MTIEIPDWLVSKIKEASQGYDIPETNEEIASIIVDVVSDWAEGYIEA